MIIQLFYSKLVIRTWHSIVRSISTFHLNKNGRNNIFAVIKTANRSQMHQLNVPHSQGQVGQLLAQSQLHKFSSTNYKQRINTKWIIRKRENQNTKYERRKWWHIPNNKNNQLFVILSSGLCKNIFQIIRRENNEITH